MKRVKREYVIWISLFTLAFLVRVISVLPFNTIIGFDQARDLFEATKIFRDGNIAIIGPTAGNNPFLHHGVAFWYYMIFPLLISGGNPMGVVLWNSLFNAGSAVILYILGKEMFKSERVGIIAGILAGVSYYYVQFSGWLSNPTATFFTLPLVFLGWWVYKKGKNWGLPLSFFFLGLTIQFELFFVYLIPVGIIIWVILKPKWPAGKLIGISMAAFLLSVSTMILTEVKFSFGGVRSLLFAGQFVGERKTNFFGLLGTFLKERWETFYLNIWPQNETIGTAIGIACVLFLMIEIIKNRQKKEVTQRNLFLVVWFFSPALMFLLGEHNAPWFYIGRPAAAILMVAYVISKMNFKITFMVVSLAVYANLVAISGSRGRGQILLGPDAASVMSDQIRVVDYTYRSSNGEAFEINSLTNPLYVNAVLAYQYYWYGKRQYGYLPSFAGGEQLYPYNTLATIKGNEKYLYLLIDSTFRIPPQYRNELIKWAGSVSELVENKKFGGIEVQKRKMKISI